MAYEYDHRMAKRGAPSGYEFSKRKLSLYIEYNLNCISFLLRIFFSCTNINKGGFCWASG